MNGFHFGFLVGLGITCGVLASVAILFACSSVFDLFGPSKPFDNSDPPGGRSGMRIYTDNLTGCQYLARPSGSLTPRLLRDGKQVCVKEQS